MFTKYSFEPGPSSRVPSNTVGHASGSRPPSSEQQPFLLTLCSARLRWLPRFKINQASEGWTATGVKTPRPAHIVLHVSLLRSILSQSLKSIAWKITRSGAPLPAPENPSEWPSRPPSAVLASLILTAASRNRRLILHSLPRGFRGATPLTVQCRSIPVEFCNT